MSLTDRYDATETSNDVQTSGPVGIGRLARRRVTNFGPSPRLRDGGTVIGCGSLCTSGNGDISVEVVPSIRRMV